MSHFSFVIRVIKNILAALKKKKFSMAIELFQFRYFQPLGLVKNKINYSKISELAPNLETDGCDYLKPISLTKVKKIEQFLEDRNYITGSFSDIAIEMLADDEIVRDYAMPRDVLSLFFTKRELSKILQALDSDRPVKVYSNLRISVHNKHQSRSDDEKWAQEFHRDFDYPSFIKVFCYLNDVSDGFGQHEYIKGTHKNFNSKIDTKQRVNVLEVEEALDEVVVLKQVGPAGTRFIANTVGYHRGTRIIHHSGSRVFAMFTFAKGFTEWGSEYEY